MKTKNNVQKAVLRSVAVVVSFVLISFSVNGQNFWKRLIVHSGFDQIALAMVSTPDNTETSTPADNSSDYSYYQTEAEESLEMENWMVDEATFGIGYNFLEQATEFSLEVEDWMMEESIFQPELNSEAGLDVEDWMTDVNIWSI